MIKIAIFVEGQTELIFIREYLLKMYDYQNVSLDCYTLFTDNKFNSTDYSFPNEQAGYYFQIINVGTDATVLSRLLKREKYLWNAGFSLIFGLRDMFSETYKKIAKGSHINKAINNQFIEGTEKQILESALKPNQIHFHYAIMEIEAWLLGLGNWIIKMDGKLTEEYVNQNLGVSLSELDPENAFFHPTIIIEQIFALIGIKYGKRADNVNSIMGHLHKDDFLSLAQLPKNLSFNTFHQKLPFPN